MKLEVQLQGQTITCEVIYRKRKTLEIQIKEPGTVRMLVPLKTTPKRVDEVLQLKAPWIIEKLALLEVASNLTTKAYVDGEQFLYLGSDYNLQIKVDRKIKKPFVALQGKQLLVTTPTAEANQIRKALVLWYRQQAQQIIERRVAHHQRWLKKVPTEVKVKEQKKRWGSCTGAGKVLFNWRIVMAPLPIIDYLVVHEMCHLQQMNHSKEFWQLVASILPDYQARRNWLKEHGVKLDIG
ncbi:SprT family zinc-dependent metalloprotease [Peptococcaceae bacterium 1198_IL3148]